MNDKATGIIKESWSTQNEIDFINGLAKWEWVKRQPFIPREALLKNYIKGAKERYWGGRTPNIDWNKCVKHAEGLLSGKEITKKTRKKTRRGKRGGRRVRESEAQKTSPRDPARLILAVPENKK